MLIKHISLYPVKVQPVNFITMEPHKGRVFCFVLKILSNKMMLVCMGIVFKGRVKPLMMKENNIKA
jgi:hypothetical protein